MSRRPMDTSTLTESFPETARAAFEPSVAGAQLRRRIVAVGGFGLLVLGFFVAVGLGRLVAFLVLGAAVVAALLVVVRSLRGRADHVGRSSRTDRARGATENALKRIEAAARRPIADMRAHRQGAKGRASVGRTLEQASRLNARGVELRREGRAEASVEAHQEALGLVRSVEERGTEALTLNNLALALGQAGQADVAIARFDEAAAVLRELGDGHHEGQVLANLGFLHGREGRHDLALHCLEAALGKLDRGSSAYRRVEDQLRRAS